MSETRSLPAGRWRAEVLAFLASTSRSMSRFADIPRVLAPTMATVIHKNWRQEGKPSAASIIPVYAKGSANMLSWNLTAPKKSGRRLSNGWCAGVVRSRTRSTCCPPVV